MGVQRKTSGDGRGWIASCLGKREGLPPLGKQVGYNESCRNQEKTQMEGLPRSGKYDARVDSSAARAFQELVETWLRRELRTVATRN